jgi:5S rRNA maturation endonuclease (ribonuclease M5)
MFGTSSDYEIYKSYAGSYSDYSYSEDEIEYVQVKLPDEMILFSQIDVNNPEHLEAYNYMVLDRKISKELLLRYRIGFCTSGKYYKRIIIPSYDANGELNYFVARTYDEKIKRSKYDNPKSNKDIIIFNEGFVNWDSTIYLVEGAFEMLTFPVNIIPMLGKTLSTALFNKLNELKPDVIVLLDPDALKDAIKLVYDLKNIYIDCEERVKLVKLPTKDDLDELRKNAGIDEVIKALRTASDLTVDDNFSIKLSKPNDFKRTRRF